MFTFVTLGDARCVTLLTVLKWSRAIYIMKNDPEDSGMNGAEKYGENKYFIATCWGVRHELLGLDCVMIINSLDNKITQPLIQITHFE